MNCTVNAKFKNSNKITSAVHTDGTSRVHTVSSELNPMYYNLGMIGKDKAPKMSVVLNLFENIGLD